MREEEWKPIQKEDSCLTHQNQILNVMEKEGRLNQSRPESQQNFEGCWGNTYIVCEHCQGKE
jgi:hypothetical protein